MRSIERDTVLAGFDGQDIQTYKVIEDGREVAGPLLLDEARLIAAAPDLLAALRECSEALEISATNDVGYILGGVRSKLKNARAAIAKAEGKP